MATSNTLTGIIPHMLVGLNNVSREMVGFIPAVRRDSTVERAALNQTVRSPIGVSGALEVITPGATPAASGGVTVNYTDVTMSSAYAAPILWSGEESRSVGGAFQSIMQDQIEDAIRKLVNAMEVDIALAAKRNASRAYGTAGTTPFGTAGDLSDLAELRRILDDNGAPQGDLQFVANNASMAKLRGKQSVLFKVNEAGSSDMLRNGMTDRLEGFAMRNSAGIALHTKGTATGALINNGSNEAVGETTLTLDTITAGATGILAGDIVTHASDATNKYVVNTGLNAAAGDIVIGKPGLLVAALNNDAVTVGNNYTGNYGFSRGAIVLATRAPALSALGDSADDRTTITDPVSGLSFEVSLYRQYRQTKIEIAAVWGVGVPNGAHLATLLG